jgi:hypothetical protein
MVASETAVQRFVGFVGCVYTYVLPAYEPQEGHEAQLPLASGSAPEVCHPYVVRYACSHDSVCIYSI